MFTVIVPDSFVKGMEPIASYLNINYNQKNQEVLEEKFTNLFERFSDGKYDFDKSGFLIGYTKQQY